MPFIATAEIKTVTYKDWGIYRANTYINNSGEFVGNDQYWQIKKPIDVSYEASVGGSITIAGMTFWEANRTNVNFYSSDDVDSTCLISTVYLSANQTVAVPANARIMIICARKINPDDTATVTVTLRQTEYVWNTSDGEAPKGGTYDYDRAINHIHSKIYDEDGTTFYQTAEAYDYDNVEHRLIYSAEEVLFPEQYSAWVYGTGGNAGRHEAVVDETKIYVLSELGHTGNYADGSKGFAYSPEIDFSQYTKMTVTYSELKTGNQYGTNAKAIIGILPTETTSVTVYNNNGCSDNGEWIWREDYVTSGVNQNGTIIYDLSGITAKGRLWLLAYSYNTYSTITATQIVLE